jgi:hypothetical protein
MSDTVSPYDAKAGILAAYYETVRADAVHAALLQFIPHGPDLIALDVGAGSGRDAAWLASLGLTGAIPPPAFGPNPSTNASRRSARMSCTGWSLISSMQCLPGTGMTRIRARSRTRARAHCLHAWPVACSILATCERATHDSAGGARGTGGRLLLGHAGFDPQDARRRRNARRLQRRRTQPITITAPTPRPSRSCSIRKS